MVSRQLRGSVGLLDVKIHVTLFTKTFLHGERVGRVLTAGQLAGSFPLWGSCPAVVCPHGFFNAPWVTLPPSETSVPCLREAGRGQACLESPSNEDLTKHPLSVTPHLYSRSSRMGLRTHVCHELMFPAMKAPSGREAQKECNDFMTSFTCSLSLRIKQR